MIDIFNLNRTLAKDYLNNFDKPWQALCGLKEFITLLFEKLGEGYEEVEKGVFLHESVRVCASAIIMPPCIIGPFSEVRQGAYVRGGVLAGEGCVIGNSSEVKNSVLFDGVQIPHFNYVGDSVLGYKAHLGAGAVTSNLKLDGKSVKIDGADTGLRKVGAFIGDCSQIGCNSVLNPGTVIGKNCIIYPLSRVRGTVPDNAIYKDGQIKKRLF